MKKQFLLISLLFLVGVSFAQSRNFKLVKAPTDNPTNQKRKAVVIGMKDYGDGRNLNNTLNDANDMASVLTQLGFEVTLLTNNDLRNLETNLNNWYSTIQDNDMAVFYFAGHGMEVNGVNYLIPVDVSINSESDVKYNALNVNKVLDNMDEKRVGMKLLILDACRDNPFQRGWSRGGETRGLSQMSAPRGTYIAFAASPGFTAQDGENYHLKNGVFTHFLKQEIIKEGASIDEIFNYVAGDVNDLTLNKQTPFKNSSLTRAFYFKPKANDKPAEPFKKYYYYVDANANKSTQQFNTEEAAETYMKANKIYGKIYSNTGEIFVIEAPYTPISPSKPVINTNIKQKLTEASTLYYKKNYSEAFAIYSNLNENDLDPNAMCLLGQMYENGNGVIKNYLQAKYWYQKAENAGDKVAMRYLGLLYYDGHGVTQSYKEAMRWFQKGAAAEETYCFFYLGLIYEFGNDVPQDYSQAKYWYQKAANGGSTTAMKTLGEFYELGHGVIIDFSQAKYWFQKAADAGDEAAKKKLATWNQKQQ